MRKFVPHFDASCNCAGLTSGNSFLLSYNSSVFIRKQLRKRQLSHSKQTSGNRCARLTSTCGILQLHFLSDWSLPVHIFYFNNPGVKLTLKCENKFRMAGEDSGEAEFTPAQKSNEAVAPRCKEKPQTLRLH